ncbi:leucine rich repeat protein [Phyllosticta citriasiana]|uniref:Leucine rich repeat protein n=1 Tax=Phyllosticta citriasiana TaxID=595635 RepID=A0ABR1KX04_9PEZI
MNDVLPSYEAANAWDVWPIVATYISSRDLCAAALVCREWARIFTRQLWGNPASHFGVENDVVYVALTRFKRTLAWARLCTRETTHTLHLPPAHAEIYDGPHSDWLRNVLERLPRLQSLVVAGLPFFDHGALMTLRRPSAMRQTSLSDSLARFVPQCDVPLFALRYLDASNAPNTTYSGLAEALLHFPALMYLDLSRTKPAKDANVLSVLKSCYCLRILKLRGLALTDVEMEALASAAGLRLKSLDVRDNQLTDASARLLLDHCFNTKRRIPLQTGTESLDIATPVRSPSSASDVPPRLDPRLIEQYDKNDLDEQLRLVLMEEFHGNAYINETYDGGITHLYMSNNSLTVEGVSGLLRSRRLNVLDVGTVARGLTEVPRPKSLLAPEDNRHTGFTMPGVEKLTPVIHKYAADKLTYLRINHAVITEETSAADMIPGRVELPGDLNISGPADAQELDGSLNEIHMMSSEETAIHEMPGHEFPTHLPYRGAPLIELPGDLPSISTSFSSPQVTIEPPSARTPSTQKANPFDDNNSATELPLLSRSQTPDPFTTAPEPLSTLTPSPSATLASRLRDRLSQRQSDQCHLHPSMLPRATELVLTDIPATTPPASATTISSRLTQFVADCAAEASIARLRARRAYDLPPGRDRAVAEREYARALFALRRVVLEVVPAAPSSPSSSYPSSDNGDVDAKKAARSRRRKKPSPWRVYPTTKSSTEDADSEAFWAAAEGDFSFFDDAADPDECGVPALEPGRGPPLPVGMGEKIALVAGGEGGGDEMQSQRRGERGGEEQQQHVDVVKAVAAFRAERRRAYADAVEAAAQMQDGDQQQQQQQPVSVEGHWEGEIRVVRLPLLRGGDVDAGAGEVDCYGNYFERGFNYR